ncbi:MAG: type I methionyl aminopeptidase [Clostridiales bacterium]|nr:type I methionyl aminopeptidase [Clostridiales bacterium]
MIHIKSASEIAKMRLACALTAQCMNIVETMIKPGVTTREIDKKIEDFLKVNGATPSFKGYNGYPASICASINEQVVHGIPSSRKLLSGDIIGIDLGAYLDGFHGDMARTYAVGDVLDDVQLLIDTAKDSFDAGLSNMVVGARVGDVSASIDAVIRSRGFTAVRSLCGHGIGRALHEEPEVPNFGTKGRGIRLRSGMILAVEPMVNQGTYDVYSLQDGWTIVTADGKLSAHYENTVLITDNGPQILTIA